jgi:hypothetical protein
VNKPILITGCQRSGTTLLSLILDSHPDIVGIDETQFEIKQINEYVTGEKYHPSVSFKLPAASHVLWFPKKVPGIKVLWCMRDPRDVVLSMLNLKLDLGDTELPWAANPRGARQEIENIAKTLQQSTGMDAALADLYITYKDIAAKDPFLWSREELVYVAALCWRLKQEILPVYNERGIAYRIVSYEMLVKEPENTIREILDFVELPWHANVLAHHLLHSGVSAGETRNDRPIDSLNTGKWKSSFDTQSLNIIKTLCFTVAAQYGYK